jgi:curli biogenesis system outer membrane secretion channel CsgG
LLLLSGCFSSKPFVSTGKEREAGLLNSYQGPQAKIAVNDFELKTAGTTPQVSQALKDYLLNILSGTRRFTVVAPQEADLIVSVGIIEFVPENSGGKNGVAGGGSSASSFMGGLLGEVLNKANMQLNVRIIDRATSELLSARDIQSQVVENPAKKIKFPQDKIFRDGLSDYLGTPMGKVIYDCITESAKYIVQSIPEKYYNNQK